ncbi:hypothetical protein, partial [Stenotrophomonas sp. PSU-St22]
PASGRHYRNTTRCCARRCPADGNAQLPRFYGEPPAIEVRYCRPLAGNLAMPPKLMGLPASGRHYRNTTRCCARRCPADGNAQLRRFYGKPPAIEIR